MHNRQLHDLMVLMFNVKNGLSPKYILELFQLRRVIIIYQHQTLLYLVMENILSDI